MPVPAHPYPFTLDEPLLWWSDTNPWTIRDACEGTQIFGDVGSGKTSGSGKTIAKSMLSAGFGGLVLCKKIDEAASWIQLARETGRSEQLLIVNPRQPWRFNFLDYTFQRSGEGGGHVENAVQLFMSIIENQRDIANQAAHQQRFFLDGARRLIRTGMEVLLLAGEPVTIDNLMRLFSSTPFPHPQTGAPVWPQQPADEFLGHTLATAIFRDRHGLTVDAPTQAKPEALQAYFLREFARPGTDRQSAGILSTFTGMADPFLSGPVKELFCTTTNFLPAEFSRKGAIIILDLPLDEYEEIGRTAALTLKYIWQRGILRRQGLRQPGDVPVFLWADESQNFITPADPKFMNECRSSVCANVYMTQNINNYMAGFHQNAEAMTNSLLAGMNTKIAHRNGDYRTNEWFAETCARDRVMFYSGGTSESHGISQNHSYGRGTSGSSSPDGGSTTVSSERGGSTGYSRERSTNQGFTEQMEFQVQPEMFTRMKSGGPQNDNEVQAVVFKSGSVFPPNGKPFIPVVFRQG